MIRRTHKARPGHGKTAYTSRRQEPLRQRQTAGAAALSIFGELRRRNVFRVGIAYAIAAWVILQIIDVVSPILELPEWAPKLILVILGVGFVPALIFAWAFELTPEGLKKEKEVDRSQSITNQTGRKLDFAIIGILLVAIGLLLVDRYIGAPVEAPGVSLEKSIAVLPFVNMSSDAEQDFFSDGITEEILNSLAAVKELKVAGRTSSFAFKGQNQDLRKIGDTLGVEHILEGSVRKAGTKIRITAQLIQVEDGFHMWSDTYDRELTDIFAIQDEIASEILTQLKAQLLDEGLADVESQRTDPQVYEWYLLAKQRIYARTKLNIESAAALLDKAIALDPDYAPAIAQRGIATFLLSDQVYGEIPNLDAQSQGEQYVRRSLELDPDLAEGWAGLGLYYSNEASKHEAAIEALTRALDLNPNLIDASNWLYVVFAEKGDARAGLQIVEDMVARDPLYRPAFGNSINTYGQFGYYEKGWDLIERFAAFYPNDPQVFRARSMLHLWNGDAAKALPLAKKALELQPTDNVFRVTYSFGLAQTSQLEKLVEEGAVFFKPGALYELGRKDEAFTAAAEFAEQGFPDALFTLLNLDNRSHELLAYLEERWSSLDAFVRDRPHDQFGYDVMVEIAIAYRRAGKMEKFDQAMQHVELAMNFISEQGLDNIAFKMSKVRQLALLDERDAAFAELEQAIAGGIQYYGHLRDDPAYESLREDPRLLAVQETMTANINTDRVALGLDPI
jgi:TolB-like protein